MKNQYFGDANDFFKYDLVLTLVEGIGGGRSFTFIPMLTAADGSRDGGSNRYDGSRRPNLYNFLQRCIAADADCHDRGARRITQLRTFFLQENVLYRPYLDDDRIPRNVFAHATRAEYFGGIGQGMLDNAVILLDPDNGMQVASMHLGNGHKYVTYEEIRILFGRMSTDSLLLVYQHFPRVDRRRYIEERCAELIVKSGAEHVIVIWNCRIAFFIVAKDVVVIEESHRIIKRLIRDYSGKSGRCRYCIHPREIPH